MPRFFTLQQAEQVLPDVDSAIREAIALKAEYDRSETELQNFSQRVSAMGGVQVDRAQFLERQRGREEGVLALKQAIEKIQGFGCVLKDLDIGLIDFPTLFRGKEVYLCWKLGEAGIQFWHGVDEGFRGRKAIDAGFLEDHRGEQPGEPRDGRRGELPS
jgi:hypothetical protein